jgi:iron complex transport system substrate-binding protein
MTGLQKDSSRAQVVRRSNGVLSPFRSVFLLLILLFVSIGADAQRIVSLMPSATYALEQIGAGRYVVGRTSYCPDGSEYGSVVVGDALTVSVETIVALRPTVVIASVFTKTSTIERLRSLGISVEQLATPKDFDDLCSQTIQLAKLVKMEKEATRHVGRERKKVEAISASCFWKPAPAYVQVGAKPIWGATPDYYIEDILNKLKLYNVIGEGEGGVSREEVLSRSPEYIIVSSMGGLGKDERLTWQRLSQANVLLIEEETLNSATPTFFRVAMEKIAALVLNAESAKSNQSPATDAVTGATSF